MSKLLVHEIGDALECAIEYGPSSPFLGLHLVATAQVFVERRLELGGDACSSTSRRAIAVAMV